MSTAQVTLDTELDLRAVEDGRDLLQADVVVALSRERQGHRGHGARWRSPTRARRWTARVDEFGYEWLTLTDPDFEDLVTTIHVTAQSMTDDGFGEQLLCALFGFEPGNVRFIYNFKRGTFYPFVPQRYRTRATPIASSSCRPSSSRSCRSRPSSSAGIRSGTPRSRTRKTAEGLWRRPTLGPAPGRSRSRDPPAPDRARVVRVARRHLRRSGSVDADHRLLAAAPRRLCGDHRETEAQAAADPAGRRPDDPPAHARRRLLRSAPGRRTGHARHRHCPTRRAGASTTWRPSTAPTGRCCRPWS